MRSRLTVPALAPILLFGTALPARAQTEPTRELTVDACVAIAITHNADVLASNADVRGAEAARAGVGGQFAPKIHADGAVQQWNGPWDLSFGGAAIRARNAFTWSAGATLSEPILGLWQIYDEYKVRDFGVDVAAIARAATRRQIAFETIDAYYRLLEVSRLSEVAEASIFQLTAQEKQAQSLYANGVIGKNDLLRATLALSSARQRAIQARGAITIERGRLARAMGISPDAPLEPVPFTGEPPPPGEPSLASAEAHALSRRLELRQIARQIEQADAGVGAAQTKLLPQINAVGNFTHVAGSLLAQANAAYVGVVGSWDVWDWGTTASGIGEADALLARARQARKKIESQVLTEAQQAFVDAETAHEKLGVAREAVEQAEENYRIVSKKFENNAATSFDMVDAEALLTQARAQVQTALYDYLIARAALDRATGAALPGAP